MLILTIACVGRTNAEVPLPAGLLARAEREGSARVLIELQGGREAFQANEKLVFHTLEGTRYRVTRHYQTVPVLALEVSAEALRRLSHSPAVRDIQEDRVLSPQEQSP